MKSIVNTKYILICYYVQTIVFVTSILAQEPDVLWEYTFGGVNSDFGHSVIPTTDRGYIIAGTTESSGADSADIYLIKTNGDGQLIWTKTYGGIYDDEAYGIHEISDGGFIVVGHTYSYGVGAPTSSNIILIKTDRNGDSIWTKVIGGIGNEVGYAVDVLPNDEYIIAGATTSAGSGGWDIYWTKINSNGDSVWSKTYGDTLNDLGYCVELTEDNGYIITGSTRSFGAGSSDVFLMKVDSSGNITWFRTYGGIRYDRGYSVQQTYDGGYIVGGQTYSFGIGSPDYTNAYFIKTDINGDTLWTVTIDEPDNDWCRCVQQSLDSGYIGIGGTNADPILIGQVYVIKINPIGHPLWIKRHGSWWHDEGYSIKQIHDGGYILTGYEATENNEWDVLLLRINAIKLIVPNGGEIWAAGQNYYISWSCENPTIDHYCALLSVDNGYIYSDTIADYIPHDSTQWAWILPKIICTSCRVKIQALDSLSNLVAEDACDTTFSILDLTSPISFSLISPFDSLYLSISRPTFTWQSSFDSVSGLENYDIYINDTLKNSDINTIWTADYDLHEGYNDWYVVAYDSAGNAQRSNETWTVIIDTTPPSIVNLIAPPNYGFLNDSSVDFVWHKASDNMSGIDYYFLQSALDTEFTQGLVETITVDTSFIISLSDTIYYWHVKAFDLAHNEGFFSSIWRFGIGGDTLVPIMPTLLSPIGGIILDDTLVVFEWTVVTKLISEYVREFDKNAEGSKQPFKVEASSSLVRYIIQIDTLLSFVSPLIVDTLDTIWTVKSLYENIPFYWRVKAYDWAGNQSPYSNPDSFGIDAGPVIESTTVWIDTSFTGPFEILTKVTDDVSGVDSVILYFKRNEDPDWLAKTMHYTAVQDWYIDSIPEVDTIVIDTVRYYIEATDILGHVAVDPPGAPVNYYSFLANCEYGIMESIVLQKFFSVNLKSNPSRGGVIFQLTIPKNAIISLSIYDICGRLMDILISGKKPAGYYEIHWCAKTNAGVYFYVLESFLGKRTGKFVIAN